MPKPPRPSPLFILVAMLTALAAMYFAREILLPVSLAILLSFLLTPLADSLERWRLPRTLAVIVVVAMSFAVLGGLGWIVTDQLVSLSRELPKHEKNLLDKIRKLQPSSKTFAGVSKTVSKLRTELIDGAKPAADDTDKSVKSPGQSNPNIAAKTENNVGASKNSNRDSSPLETGAAKIAQANKMIESPDERAAIPVRVVGSSQSPFELIRDWLGPLVAPLTTAGIVVILVLFMLLDREGQRSRLIQLFGRSHFHTTTEAIHDVARRVGRYLRTLFLVNAGYGFVVATGLSFIGVPNAMLWGALAFAMRFLPYLGPWIAASLPMLISIATSDGWTQPLLVFGWYLAVELVVYNFIEPFVYGGIVGVSTVGIFVAALFWTWLWGPVGLVLAMPMTVCLLVAARYVPQLRFLTILLADQQPLSVPERVYQRLLAFDYHEPLKLAQKHFKESSLASFYDDVLIPALRMAEQDRHEDLLSDDQSAFVLESAGDLVQELGDEAFAAITTNATGPDATPLAINSAGGKPQTKARVLCIPLRDQADETASHMLAQLLVAEGFDVATEGANSLISEVVERVADSACDLVVISIVPPIRPRDSRLLWKRLRDRYPDLPIVVGFWSGSEHHEGVLEPELQSKVATTLSHAVAQVRALAEQIQLASNDTGRVPAAG